MSKKFLIPLFLFFSTFSQLSFAGEIDAQTGNPRILNERFVVRALLTLNSAQATYAATSGNGNYGSFNDLRQQGFIDPVLASGNKYGYLFSMTIINRTATTPARFSVTATTRRYPKTGRSSFFINETGELRGADKSGVSASVADPIIDSCAAQGFSNEYCTIQELRALYSAEMTYQATFGNGNFGLFQQLYDAGLIRLSMSFGQIHGYNFTVVTIGRTSNTPAFFKFNAAPITYRVTGLRSFYIDVNGVIRGADKGGASADENDPPIVE